MAKQLNVSGAFHSPLMEPAAEKLARALETITIKNAEIPVYANVSARPITDAGEIRESLLQQLTAPVRWSESVLKMSTDGADEFVEVGPGTVLQGLVRRILPGATISGVEHLGQIAQFNQNNQ